MNAIDDIAAERRRQAEVECWSSNHDDRHSNGELALAAASYAVQSAGKGYMLSDLWPWELSWWKPTTSRRDLVKAGALIVAEIERLDRAQEP